MCEAGLYKTPFRSKTPNGANVYDWVCSEVLPTIGKYRSYMSDADAKGKMQNARCITLFHYNVK